MDKEYKTKDLGEAATLVALGIPILSINWINSVAWFSFKDSAERTSLTHGFYYGNLQVGARALLDSYKTIKSKLFPKDRNSAIVR